mmetsp:Transcript_5103/g.9696  ORF Transcript_5103/g.9696 Transcript_5103/m.9696 type:complete len:235 (+) Transcript_5103:141-845(+)
MPPGPAPGPALPPPAPPPPHVPPPRQQLLSARSQLLGALLLELLEPPPPGQPARPGAPAPPQAQLLPALHAPLLTLSSAPTSQLPTWQSPAQPPNAWPPPPPAPSSFPRRICPGPGTALGGCDQAETCSLQHRARSLPLPRKTPPTAPSPMRSTSPPSCAACRPGAGCGSWGSWWALPCSHHASLCVHPSLPCRASSVTSGWPQEGRQEASVQSKAWGNHHWYQILMNPKRASV